MSVMSSPGAFAGAHPAGAVVSKVDPVAHADRYLLVTETGAVQWVDDLEAATAFASMREAARMAVRLPAGQRAFGVPARQH